MRTPRFWNRPPGLLAALLWPLGWIYGRITVARMRGAGLRVGVRVVCFGNFTAGGTGKTPAAIQAAEVAIAAGEQPFFLSRGYGGRLAGPVRVDPQRHGAADCGDEPLLLARTAPVIVARDRAEGARLAVAEGATLIIMDDGLQNPGLAKDAVIAVADGETGVGSGFCIPAGPLRAPLRAQLPLADALLVLGPGAPGDALAEAAARLGKPVLRASLVPRPEHVAALEGRPLFAFAGIGRPEKFFATLARAGLDVRLTRSFSDHQAYADENLRHLGREAAQRGLVPVMTEKDAVKIGDRLPGACVVGVTLALDPASRGIFDALLSGRTPPARGPGAAAGSPDRDSHTPPEARRSSI